MQLSIVVPIHNEILYISRSFESIILAGSEVDSEFFFVDGQSNDGTYEWIEKAIKNIDNCRLILNDKKFVSHGFNLIFNQTKGKFISRVDGHTIYPKSYFSDALDIFSKNNADVVGGPANHIGISWRGKVIANCMMHPFGVGNSKFRISKEEQYVDTVPFPIYRRKVLEKIGLYDEELIKNQDDELNYRCVENGFKILMNPKLETNYLVRDNLIDLSKQYFFYGFYKPLVFKKVSYGARFYQFVPAIHSILSILSLAVFPYSLYSLYYFICYLIFALMFSIKINMRFKDVLYSTLTFFTIHFSYGIGFIQGYFNRVKIFFSQMVSSSLSK